MFLLVLHRVNGWIFMGTTSCPTRQVYKGSMNDSRRMTSRPPSMCEMNVSDGLLRSAVARRAGYLWHTCVIVARRFLALSQAAYSSL